MPEANEHALSKKSSAKYFLVLVLLILVSWSILFFQEEGENLRTGNHAFIVAKTQTILHDEKNKCSFLDNSIFWQTFSDTSSVEMIRAGCGDNVAKTFEKALETHAFDKKELGRSSVVHRFFSKIFNAVWPDMPVFGAILVFIFRIFLLIAVFLLFTNLIFLIFPDIRAKLNRVFNASTDSLIEIIKKPSADIGSFLKPALLVGAVGTLGLCAAITTVAIKPEIVSSGLKLPLHIDPSGNPEPIKVKIDGDSNKNITVTIQPDVKTANDSKATIKIQPEIEPIINSDKLKQTQIKVPVTFDPGVLKIGVKGVDDLNNTLSGLSNSGLKINIEGLSSLTEDLNLSTRLNIDNAIIEKDLKERSFGQKIKDFITGLHSPYFTLAEFRDGNPKELCNIIRTDLNNSPQCPSSVVDNINYLNKLLHETKLYDMISQSSHEPISLTPKIESLIAATKDCKNSEFSKLSAKDRSNMVELNRLILEVKYPICPKFAKE